MAADRLLRGAGWDMLKTNPWDMTLANYWRKAWAFLFYPNVLLSDSMFTLRSLRICLLGAAGVAMIRGWRNPILLLAASVAAYQAAVHTPLLYNPRYSEGALDLWLALLAGCGFATVLQWPLRHVLAFALTLVAACYGGKTIRHLDDRVAPLRFNDSVPHRILWKNAEIEDRMLSGFTVDAGAKALVATGERPSVRLELPDVNGISGNAKYSNHNLFLILDIWTPPGGKRCEKGRIDFQPDAKRSGKPAPESYYPFRMKRDSGTQTFSFGIAEPTATWRTAVNGPGTFKIELTCGPGGIVRLDRLAIAEATYAVAYGGGRSLPAQPVPVPVVEYYHRALDHYFITWVAEEIAALDAAKDAGGWIRTGRSFKAYATAQFDTSPVCRFYIPPELGNSHFFGSGSAECDATEHRNPRFVLESPKFMHVRLPLRGECPADTVSVYRVFNNRKDTNHRYMTDPAIRDQMAAQGWLVEGEGPDSVVMCAPR